MASLAMTSTLVEGRNVITATATDSSGQFDSDTVQLILDTDPPIVTLESPLDGTVLTSLQTDVVGQVNDIVTGTTINAEDCQVTVNGVAATVVNRSWLVEDLLLQRGLNTLNIVATDRAGNERSISAEVTVQDQAGQRIKLLAGNNQAATVGTPLANPLIVTLVDAQNAPVANQPVTFEVSRGNGQLHKPSLLAGFEQSGQLVTVMTDSAGLASVDFILGGRSGSGNHRVMATAPGFVGTVEFCATATVDQPYQITAVFGDRQTGATQEPLPLPFVALITDPAGNPVSGVAVEWSVVSGGGDLAGQSIIQQSSDEDGLVSAVLTLGEIPGAANNIVMATLLSDTNLSTVFQATAKLIDPFAPTTVSGVVLDNQDNPMSQVTMSLHQPGVDLNPVPTAVTDDQGRFLIDEAPEGHLLLIADARTTTRSGRWPKLEFDITTVAGQDNTVGMPIWVLPFADNTVTVANGGPSQDIMLTLPDLPGSELTVFANSVECAEGQSQCDISWTQVRGERVPMEPPRGASFNLTWTLQPAGAHFDPPIKVCLPNEGWLPGTQTELYSFDHDLVDFVGIGPATVSSDGAQICSDSGFGISKAGWGGAPPPGPPPCTNTSNSCPPPYAVDDECILFEPVLSGGMCPTYLCKVTKEPDGICCDGGDSVCSSGRCTPIVIGDIVVKANGLDELYIGLKDQGTAVEFTATATAPVGCDLEYEWDFGDGSNSEIGADRTHIYTTPGDYEVQVTIKCGDCSTVETRTIRVVVVDIQITRIISDQDPGVECNMLPPPASADWTSPPMHMATRTDGKAYITVEHTTTPQQNDNRAFLGIYGVLQNDVIKSTVINTNKMPLIFGENSRDDIELNVLVVAGVDTDGNGNLDLNEISSSIRSERAIRVIPFGSYKRSFDLLNDNTTFTQSTSSNLLKAFLGNTIPEQARSDGTTIVSNLDFRLTHPEGANWVQTNNSGDCVADIAEYIFDDDTDASMLISNGDRFHTFIRERIDSTKAQIKQAALERLQVQPNTNPVVDVFINRAEEFQAGDMFGFDFLNNLDLFAAFKWVHINGTLSIHVDRNTLMVDKIEVDFRVTDLYDFDYEQLQFVIRDAAKVQIGFSSHGGKSVGEIFENVVDVKQLYPTEFSDIGL